MFWFFHKIVIIYKLNKDTAFAGSKSKRKWEENADFRIKTFRIRYTVFK